MVETGDQINIYLDGIQNFLDLKSNTTCLFSNCFICGQWMKRHGIYLSKYFTSNVKTFLPDIISSIVGEGFAVVINENDEICGQCIKLAENLDLLEFQAQQIRQDIKNLLESHYGFMKSEEVASCQGAKVDQEDAWMESEMYAESSEISQPSPSANNFSFADSMLALKISAEQQFSEAPSKDTETDDSAPSPKIPVPDKTTCDESSSPFSNVTHNSLRNNKAGDLLSNDITADIFSFNGSDSFQVEVPVQESGSFEKQTFDLLDNSSASEPSYVSRKGEKKVFKCHVCDFVNESKIKVINHLDEHNVRKFNSCTICEIPFKKSAEFDKHLKLHENTLGPVQCSICNLICRDKMHFQHHRKSKHDVLKQLSCITCEKIFGSMSELKKHKLGGECQKKFYQCSECLSQFNRRTQLETHLLYSHGLQKCRVCSKHIPDPVKLRSHEKRHMLTDLRSFDCDQCHKKFKTPGGLKVHKVSHTGKFKLFCDVCGRGFMSPALLNEHKGVHTKEERYVCDICGRKFVLYSTFHLHKQWHQDPQPFPCSYCLVRFKYRSERAIHVRRIHTQELPHKCSFCSACFLKKSYLDRHLTRHTQQYFFTCSLCQRGFNKKKSLANHMARHHNDSSLRDQAPKPCLYKVALNPDEWP